MIGVARSSVKRSTSTSLLERLDDDSTHSLGRPRPRGGGNHIDHSVGVDVECHLDLLTARPRRSIRMNSPGLFPTSRESPW